MRKVCTKCGVDKPITDYNKGRKADVFGVRSRCRQCTLVDRKKYCVLYADRRKEYAKKYRGRATARQRERYHTDELYRLSRLVRGRVRDALRVGGVGSKYKARSGSQLLGCSYEEFKEYIISQFTEGMTWELFEAGEIHMDHIIPCAMFNLFETEAQKVCFNYKNIRPVWKNENLVKSRRIRSSDLHLLTGKEHLIIKNKLLIV